MFSFELLTVAGGGETVLCCCQKSFCIYAIMLMKSGKSNLLLQLPISGEDGVRLQGAPRILLLYATWILRRVSLKVGKIDMVLSCNAKRHCHRIFTLIALFKSSLSHKSKECQNFF
jgi:hypothetical protein